MRKGKEDGAAARETRVLRVLDMMDGRPVGRGELRRITGMSYTAIGETVAQLKESGLVRRVKGSGLVRR
jgi:biotin operon repressor